MANETRQLAEYAAAVRYQDLPAPVVQRAKDVIADTIATVIFGHDLPWSRMIIALCGDAWARAARAASSDPAAARCAAPLAALANGAMAHAFELDNLTWPNSGVHPGATMFVPALAVAQERGIGGRELIAAFVAGAETMIRIGRATKHNNESRGFHAPGTTGPFGAAIAVGRLLRLRRGENDQRNRNCRLARGRLAGIRALGHRRDGQAPASRPRGGERRAGGEPWRRMDSPDRAACSKGRSGISTCSAASTIWRRSRAISASEYATLRIMLKRFPCHITAHTSVQAIEDLRAEHKYSGDDVASIAIAGTEKMATINNIPAPTDLMMAQYSIPFCVALAHYRNPRDPRSFNAAAVADPAIRALAARVTMSVADEARHARTLASTVTVTLKDGRVFTRRVTDFKGTPESPLNAEEMREKFLLLTRHCDAREMARLFERLQNLENERALDWVKASAAIVNARASVRARRHDRRADHTRHRRRCEARSSKPRARSRAGGLVAFPTETVYGLGADATNAVADRAALRGQGTAGVQSADRACGRYRGGARARGVRCRAGEIGGGVLAGTADAGAAQTLRSARSPSLRPPGSIPSPCACPIIRSRARSCGRSASRSSRLPPTARGMSRPRPPRMCSPICAAGSISSSTAGRRRSASSRPSSPASMGMRCCCGRADCRARTSNACSAAGSPMHRRCESTAMRTPRSRRACWPRIMRRRRDCGSMPPPCDAGEALLAFGAKLPPGAERAVRVLNLSAARRSGGSGGQPVFASARARCRGRGDDRSHAGAA